MGDIPDEDDEVITEGELNLGGLMGLIMTYYVISGTVVLFLILRPLKLIQPVLNALGDFRVVGLVVLAIGALFINVIAVGLLVLNAENVKHIFR